MVVNPRLTGAAPRQTHKGDVGRIDLFSVSCIVGLNITDRSADTALSMCAGPCRRGTLCRRGRLCDSHKPQLPRTIAGRPAAGRVLADALRHHKLANGYQHLHRSR